MKLICLTFIIAILYGGTSDFAMPFADAIFARHSSVKVAYSENKTACKFTAEYPSKSSERVIAYLKNWCAPATQNSGNLPGTKYVKFANGLRCKVVANEGDLEITAMRAQNPKAALSKFKGSCKAIEDFILKHAAD